MKVKQTPTGIFIGDDEIVAIELTNTKGTYVKLFNYGAIINKFLVKNTQGNLQDIVLGFDTIEQYLEESFLASRACLGTVVGRYANRIAGGKLSIDGKEYELDKNVGNACLHGGEKGFDTKVWDIVEIDEQLNSVTLQYESVDGEGNFPGNLLVELNFELTENDELILSYEANTDQTTAINLTHHSYFNLSPKVEIIAQQQLQIFASNYLEQGDNYTVTGNLLPVKDTIYDFTSSKEIGQDWNEAEGYDQTFVLDKNYGDLALVAKVFEKESGLTLSIYSTEPVVHLYTAKYLKAKNGKGNIDYTGFEGICLEAHHHPNAVNISHFPSTLLKPNEFYSQTTIYKVNKN